jgi:hypothetical protein
LNISKYHQLILLRSSNPTVLNRSDERGVEYDEVTNEKAN